MTHSPSILAQFLSPGEALLADPLMLRCAAIGLLCALGLAAGLTLLRRLHRHRPAVNPLTDTNGTATIEFALVFPILLFMMLLLTQTTTLMAGNIFVNYAAYAATRSAIVQIPRNLSDDPANRFTASSGHAKHDAIVRSAAMALVPVAGRKASSDVGADSASFASGLAHYYESYNRDAPNWIDSLAAARLNYAMDHTRIIAHRTQVVDAQTVEFVQVSQGQSIQYDPREAITIRVEHDLNLAVPYVNRIYSTGEHEDGSRQYRLMSAKYTLTNEGVRDEMPPVPSVPRRTP